MAQKRMFDKNVVGSDKFLDLPNSSKALYFMAGMEADDKGFFQPRKLQRMCGFSDDDYKILIAKGFFITFESGVMVVTDWNKNNWLDSRRITETEYIDELNMLKMINNKYELSNTTDTKCLATAKPSLRENRIEENRIEENRIEENRIEEKERKKEKTFNEIIDDFTDNLDLRTELKNHLAVRKLKKGSLTNRAIELELKTLSKLSDNTNIQLEIVRQSIEKGWIGFFPVKNDIETNSKVLSGNPFFDLLREEGKL